MTTDAPWKQFIFANVQHTRGGSCDECWNGFPRKHHCGGEFHGHLVKCDDESLEPTLTTMCECCRDSEERSKHPTGWQLVVRDAQNFGEGLMAIFAFLVICALVLGAVWAFVALIKFFWQHS